LWVRAQAGLKRLPLVVLTSSREDPDINRAYELGANTYLVKPVKFEGLVEMMKALNFYWLVLAEKPTLDVST
jgi:DNA-binding response OmpR family regulator